MQYFSTRFMKTYVSIPIDVKPPLGVAKMHYADAFERIFVSLTNMMDDAIEVEVNLVASNKSKHTNETRRVKGEARASTSQSNPHVKLDMMIKVMEKLMDTLSVDDKNKNRDQNDPK